METKGTLTTILIPILTHTMLVLRGIWEQSRGHPHQLSNVQRGRSTYVGVLRDFRGSCFWLRDWESNIRSRSSSLKPFIPTQRQRALRQLDFAHSDPSLGSCNKILGTAHEVCSNHGGKTPPPPSPPLPPSPPPSPRFLQPIANHALCS